MKIDMILAKRYVKHLWYSGTLMTALEHFLVMFPSAMLIAKLSYSEYGAVVELTTILFVCGVGTLLFTLFTKVPFFLGPSFAYIGFISYQVSSVSSENEFSNVMGTIFYGYLICAVMLFILSLLYRFDSVKKLISLLFPSTVMGPAISLIGLELANIAASDSGFSGNDKKAMVLSTATLGLIIIFSVLRHHLLKNASIIIGIIGGCILANVMGYSNWSELSLLDLKPVLPDLLMIRCLVNVPSNMFLLVISVIPCVLIAFIESLGRLSVYKGMIKRDGVEIDLEKMSTSIISMHSITNGITSIFGMMPNAIYAENIAVMNLHGANLSTKRTAIIEDHDTINGLYSMYSTQPFIWASIICIIAALFRGVESFFVSIPMPVFGGMELFIFGLIAAPGIQMLVEQQVDYKKISNQIITASVLLAGVSNISITYGTISIKGMSLGLIIGTVVNLLTIFLGNMGLLNEKFTMTEIIDTCISNLNYGIILKIQYDNDQIMTKELERNEVSDYIRKKEIVTLIEKAVTIELIELQTLKNIIIEQRENRVELSVAISNKFYAELCNDNPHLTILKRNGRNTKILVDEYVSKHILGQLVKNIYA